MINVKKTVNITDDEKLASQEHEETTDIIELVTRFTKEASHVSGIVIGTLKGFNASGIPFVEFPLNPTGRPLPSRSTVALNKNHIGREVALMFEMNTVRKPIIIGLMHVPENHVEVKIEDEITVISAEKEIHIRCGESSIRLRKDGKIEIKGRDILSKASQSNKIKGGMVNVN